ncbi:MAG: acetyl-CoA C-acetyltransferase [Pseudomonadota bacterium]
MRDVVIVAGLRTPVGAFGGRLASVPVVNLGALVLKTVLKKVGLRPIADFAMTSVEPQGISGKGLLDLEKQYYDYDDTLAPVTIDEVIMGNVISAGQGQNVARQAMIQAGIPKETAAYTINKLCASGMKSVALAAQAIRCGEAEVILAGGMENMSRVPYAIPTARWGARMGTSEIVDLMTYDGLHEIFYGYHMGVTAENIASRFEITRQEQDELAAMSHQRARAAIVQNLFKNEIVPVEIPQKKGEPIVFDTDERPMETTAEKMGKLRPAFKKDGTVTAGNASGINDAAAVLLLMSSQKANELGIKPLIRIKASAFGGLDPAYMGLGPIPAVRKLFARENLTMKDIKIVELNEAFASQAIACMRELQCSENKTNLLGSGISIGHPIGCTGARILVTLMEQMIQHGHDLGLASLCIGGGQGMAMALEHL